MIELLLLITSEIVCAFVEFLVLFLHQLYYARIQIEWHGYHTS